MENLKALQPDEAKRALVRLLQNAHAGEKAAANAYYGHALSLFTRSKVEKNEIKEIYKDELHHRKRLYEILQSLDAKPRCFRELLMYTIGFTIGSLCLFGGWFLPMYGAAKLESENVEEYEIAARLVLIAQLNHSHPFLIDELLTFAEVEWDHELYFRRKAENHWLAKFFPFWKKLKKRAKIREDFTSFTKTLT